MIAGFTFWIPALKDFASKWVSIHRLLGYTFFPALTAVALTGIMEKNTFTKVCTSDDPRELMFCYLSNSAGFLLFVAMIFYIYFVTKQLTKPEGYGSIDTLTPESLDVGEKSD